jgi:DNA transformation protein
VKSKLKSKKLRPMPVSSGFREFVLGQLAEVRELHAKPMFGGLGLYSGDVFFGLVAGGVLYFKVDETIRADYEQAGSRPFKPYADRPVTMSYYGVPAAVVEDATALAQWARRSIAVARASHDKK